MKYILLLRLGGKMPYLIITYDIKEDSRLNKVRKILKKYFMWVQNSVFEGDTTKGKLEKCKRELMKVLDNSEDSLYFYILENKLDCGKIILGVEKNFTKNIF